MAIKVTSPTVEGKLLFEEESFQIRGAVFEVYREMGCGFLEAVYQECLEKEFQARKIPYCTQKELHIQYKGNALSQFYKADIICYGKIILELKAVKEIANEHRAQIINYLKATGYRVSFLINFSHYPKVQIERIVK